MASQNNNIYAEQYVIGSILLNEDAISEVVDVIKPTDMFYVQNQIIYENMLKLYTEGKPVDMATVLGSFTKDNLSSIGGLEYLNGTLVERPSSTSAKYYAEIIKSKSLLRHLQSICKETLKNIENAKDNDMEILEEAQQKILTLSKGIEGDGTKKISETMPETLSKLDEIIELRSKLKYGNSLYGVESGIHNLDRLTSGFHNGELIIIASRPSIGKSALAINIAQHSIGFCKKAVALFSLEMSDDQVNQRMLACVADVDLQKFKNGSMNETERHNVELVSKTINHLDLFVNDRASITMESIKSVCRKYKAQDKLDLVVIDYLQLITGTNKHESRLQQISTISRELKILAKDLNVPVIALSQLSRACEIRGGDDFKLSDLRESGAIEQDSDIVIFIHRDLKSPSDAKLIVAKNRNGITGSIDVTWVANITKFKNKPEKRYN